MTELNHYETAAMMALGAAVGAMIRSGQTEDEVLTLVRNSIAATRDAEIIDAARSYGNLVAEKATR